MIARDLLAVRASGSLPTILEIHVSGSDLSVTCEDMPWWKGGATEKSRFELLVKNVREWSFDSGPRRQAGPLAIETEHPLLLDHGPTASIFGQAPLPDPYRFFLEFHRAVRDTLGIPRDPVRYLNWGGSLSDWLGFVYSRSYNLLSAPLVVAEAAKELLEAQVADFIVLPDKKAADGAALSVLLFGESFAIGEAVEFRAA